MIDLVSIGKVSSIDPKNMTARVVFEDKDNIVSDDFSIIVPFTKKDKFYSMPAINEQVLCVMLPNSTSNGYIIGSIYNEEDSPPISDKDKFHIKFEDETTIEYDKKTHTLNVDCKGDINLVTTGKCNIKSKLYVDGEITAKGSITANSEETI